MGWLVYNHIPRDIRGEVIRICTGESESRRIFPIGAEQVGDVWYVAVRAEFNAPEVGRQWARERDYVPNEDGSYVFAAVLLTSIENGEWGYKDMDETCGPNASDAPRSILGLLSATTHPYAADWRARCRANLAVRGCPRPLQQNGRAGFSNCAPLGPRRSGSAAC